MKTIIFFFSKDGSTGIAAEYLSKLLNAEMVELKESRNRHGFISSGFRAARKKSGHLIGSPEKKIAQFDRIIIGTPVWAGNGTPAVNGFLDAVDLSNKDVILYTVQADPKLKGSQAIHDYLSDKISKKGANLPVTCYALQGNSPGKPSEKERIENQIDKLGIK